MYSRASSPRGALSQSTIRQSVGTLQANVENDGGIIAMGNSPGTLHIVGDFTQAPSGTLEVELSWGGEYDKLEVTGQVYLDGILEINLIDGFMPEPTDTFEIVTGASFAGAFNEVVVTSNSGGTGTFDVAFTESGIALSNFQRGAPGDFNDDGVLDAADYVAWRKTGMPPDGYNTWRADFGHPSGSGSVASANATVPEPTTLVMLIVTAVRVSTRRRSRTWQVSKLINA
jgi:hypothetical protein